MEWVIFTAIIALSGLIVYAVVLQKSKWKTVFEGNGLDDDTSNQYGYLQKHDIRCRIRQLPTRTATQGSMVSAMHDEDQQKVRLEVHKDDFERAQELLRHY